jgi:hypothetical protein
MVQKELIQILRFDFNSSIVGIYMFFTVLLLAYISFNFRLYVQNIIKANLSFRLLKNQAKDDSNISRKASVWMNLFFLMVTNLGVYFFVQRYLKSFFETEGEVLAICTLLTFSVFLVKYGFKLFIGKVFKTEFLTDQYFVYTSIRDQGFSLAIFPILIVFEFNLYFQEFSLLLGKICILIYFVFRWISGFLVGIKLGNIPFFYSILYICTLEILPLGVVLKTLGQNL